MEQDPSSNGHSSIDAFLMKKYGHTDIAKMDFPDLRNKTAFVDKKGNDISAGVLSYAEAEEIVETFLNTPIP